MLLLLVCLASVLSLLSFGFLGKRVEDAGDGKKNKTNFSVATKQKKTTFGKYFGSNGDDLNK